MTTLKRKGNSLNVRSKAQLLFAHALTHSRRYQLGVGCAQARKEHGILVKMMRKRSLNHSSAFVCLK